MTSRRMEEQIARCRILLSVAAMLVVYIDPQTPFLAHWIPFVSGRFMMDFRLFAVMGVHLVYSILLYISAARGLSQRLAAATAWVDMGFAVVIAVMTEGVTSPAYPFFGFAVVSAGLISGPRRAMLITTVSLALYVCLLLVSTHEDADVYILRPIYLGITGYLLVYLGQQRVDLEERMRQLEVAEQRHRIARDLHDGYAQALAGINLRLETARRMLRTNTVEEVHGDLTQLQESVQREFDDLRDYVRSLAGVEPSPAPPLTGRGTRLVLQADLVTGAALAADVLSIAREAVSNILRHAGARHARLEIRGDEQAVRLLIADDGVGFVGDQPPWTIASRVREAGGQLEVGSAPSGTRLQITLPQA
ncbi:MAG: histidine kinase [Deltaproteobacteria bacterium]|nr:histidine kinase [Deltaproteobacteria bacterium]